MAGQWTPYPGSGSGGGVQGGNGLPPLATSLASGDLVEFQQSESGLFTPKTISFDNLSNLLLPRPSALALNKSKIRFGFFGDSRAANAFSTNSLGGNGRTNSWGMAYWLGMLTGGLVVCPPSLGLGISGQTSAQILARVGTAAASDADAFMVYAGINDNPSNFAGTIQNIIGICTALSQAGKLVFMSCEYPLNTLSGAAAAQLMYLRHQIMQLDIPNVTPVDFWPQVQNNNTSNAAWDNAKSYDGEHPNPTGGLVSAMIVAPYFKNLSPAVVTPIGIGGDAYNATINPGTGLPTNPAGNLLSNGRLSGTTGTVTGSVTGTAPTVWTLAAGTGWTVTATQTTLENQITETFVCAGTPSDSSQVVAFEQSVAATNLIAGDTLELSSQLSVTAGSSNCYGPMLEILAGGVPIVSAGYGDVTATNGSGTNFGTAPALAYAGNVRTQDYTVPNPPVALTIRWVLKGAAAIASACTFEVAGIELKKTTSGGLPV